MYIILYKAQPNSNLNVWGSPYKSKDKAEEVAKHVLPWYGFKYYEIRQIDDELSLVRFSDGTPIPIGNETT